jgi:hypothetical protein
MILRIPWFSQYDAEKVERAGDAACFRACRAMAAAAGVRFPESTEKRFQVATVETPEGVALQEASTVGAAVEVLRRQLREGMPIIAGVNHRKGSPNRDGITDHFVLVVGWSSTPEMPEVFLALDPGRPLVRGTTHNTELAVDAEGALVRTWPRRGKWLEMQVSMLVLPE